MRRAYPVHVFLPESYGTGLYGEYPVVIMNDGQDAARLHLREQLAAIEGHVEPFVLVTVPALSRMQSYGISLCPDYAGRGSRAKRYGMFIALELMPFLRARYDLSPQREETGVLGFSLGGLSAFDIGWQFPEVFGKVGAFSASFWWRRRAKYQGESADDCRLLHEVIRHEGKREGLKFYLQVGTEDEKEDRNHNGIIDAIDDTLDLIKELDRVGYDRERDIAFNLVQGGRHDPYTWGRVLPDFFRWFTTN